MIRLFAAFLISIFSCSAFAQGVDYKNLTQRMDSFRSHALANIGTDGSLPSSIEWSKTNGDASLWDTNLLVSARPQSFVPEDFSALIKLGERANAVTVLYVNGPKNDTSRSVTRPNEEKYQEDITHSSVFSIHALANVAQGLSAFYAQLSPEEQEKPARLQGKIVLNSSIFQQFAAVSAMAVGDHIKESNRVKMVGALSDNLMLYSPILTDDTLTDIDRNLRIRLLQLLDGTEIKTKVTALRDSVVAIRDDQKRREVLTN